tara:strand:- start:1906 stop:2142 length:237 start_codon:yes stop_codon:yes gene_type:complete
MSPKGRNWGRRLNGVSSLRLYINTKHEENIMKYTGLNLREIKGLEAKAEQGRQARENRDAKKIRQRLNRAKARRQEVK